MNELQFAHRIRQLLDHGAAPSARVAQRLRESRELALERRRADLVAGYELANNVFGRMGLGGLSLRVLAPVVALGIAFAATYSWEQTQRAAEVEELDALLLTSDLPIDAYLDQGFQAWLKRRSSQ